MNGRKKSILLVAPKYVDLYKDIISALQEKGFDVEYICTEVIPGDPFFAASASLSKASEEEFLNNIKQYWLSIKNGGGYTFVYDYLLVVNGTNVHPVLIDMLKENNPSIKTYNFLFDSTRVYNFDRNFSCYDRIYSFDKTDVERFGLTFLPIYWIDDSFGSSPNHFVFFGFGGYNKLRLKIFRQIEQMAEARSLPCYIKVYHPRIKSLAVHFVKKLFRDVAKRYDKISISEYKSKFVTTDLLSPRQFRQCIHDSDVIVDTSNTAQDGLTARFMWAVGQRKKIITNNESVRHYGFYDPSFVYIIGDKLDEKELLSFVEAPMQVSDSQQSLIDSYRIDKWLDYILEL